MLKIRILNIFKYQLKQDRILVKYSLIYPNRYVKLEDWQMGFVLVRRKI